ncbi:MAG: hypothetical protein ACRCZI_14180, partial [Cetobacterium sp.]
TAVLPRKPGGPEQLRIPANSKAMAVLIYMNNWKKWTATHAFKKKYPGTNLSRYSSKRPEMKLPFKEKYTSTGNTVAHKKHPEWGGWSEEGRKNFVQLQAKVMASRQDNLTVRSKPTRNVSRGPTINTPTCTRMMTDLTRNRSPCTMMMRRTMWICSTSSKCRHCNWPGFGH